MTAAHPSSCRARARAAASALAVLALLAAIVPPAMAVAPAASARRQGARARIAPRPAASAARAPSPAPGPPLRYEPSLYLSWHAPYGSPGASDRIVVSCGDTARVDTLFLSFETGRQTMGLLSLSAVVYFHPQRGDSLGTFWHFKRGWENQNNLLIDFDQVAGLPGELPWRVMGYGSVTYDHRSGRGRLDLSFSIQLKDIKALNPDNRYTFARLRIRHQRNTLPGCEQPVCVELADLRLKFGTGHVMTIDRGPERFACWNSRDGAVCNLQRGLRPARAWRPTP